MDMIQGSEWIIIAILVVGFIISAYLVLSVQGDLTVLETSGTNTDEEAAKIFIDLVNQTDRQIDIHDDGNYFPASIYNDQKVMDTLRNGITRRNIKVRCLFNDADPHLELFKLASSEGFRSAIEIWRLNGDRPERDTHYKIVDGGRLVHLSSHAHGASERGFRLRKAQEWWKLQTRKRISKQYRDHFENGLRNAVQVV